MIIEFLGMPGCGKSYLANQLARHSNKRIINLTEKSRASIFFKVYFRLLRSFLKIDPRYQAEKKNIVEILREYQSKPAAYNDIYINNYINQIVLYKYFYNKFSKLDSIFLLDEGVYQQFVNMMVNYDISLERVDRVIEILGYYPRTFYIKCTLDTAIQSIEKRNRHVCYIDELQGGKRLDFLSLYNECCEQLKERYNIMVLDREDNTNCFTILEKIKEV